MCTSDERVRLDKPPSKYCITCDLREINVVHGIHQPHCSTLWGRDSEDSAVTAGYFHHYVDNITSVKRIEGPAYRKQLCEHYNGQPDLRITPESVNLQAQSAKLERSKVST